MYIRKQSNLIFFGIFLFSFLCFYAYVLSRGFGWDGDSVVIACQFIKIINPNIFGVWDPGTTPKLMSIFTFGIFYKIFGNFYALTFLSIVMNSLIVALICKWVFENGGYWFITLVGLLSCIGWLDMVVICDTPAFSIPCIFCGLYYYFHKNHKIIGSFLIFIASLFRPGPEIVLLLIMFIELRKNNKNTLFLSYLFLLFLLGVAHVAWGHKLAYINKEDLYSNNNSCKYSLTAILPFLKDFLALLAKPRALIFFILAIFGFARLKKEANDIKYAALSIFQYYLCPISTFVVGQPNFSANYFREFLILIAIFSGFLGYKSGFFESILIRLKYKSTLRIITLLALIVFIIFIGIQRRGSYEVNPNESGIIKWKGMKEVRSLFAEESKLRAAVMDRDVVFFILDMGCKLKKLDVLHNTNDIQNIQYNNYDVILIPRNAEYYCNNNIYTFFKKIYLDNSRLIFIRKSTPAPCNTEVQRIKGSQ